MAAASGLALVPAHTRKHMKTTTCHTDQLVVSALHSGCRRLIFGIGGSAASEGGANMSQAKSKKGILFFKYTAPGKEIISTGKQKQ